MGRRIEATDTRILQPALGRPLADPKDSGAARWHIRVVPFMTRYPTSRKYREALQGWRSAAEMASDRWTQFTVAEQGARPFMYAAYVAALDREEAAAAELALRSLGRAA